MAVALSAAFAGASASGFRIDGPSSAKQAGSSAAKYLGLTLPRKGDVVIGIIVVSVFIVLVDGISWLF